MTDLVTAEFTRWWSGQATAQEIKDGAAMLSAFKAGYARAFEIFDRSAQQKPGSVEISREASDAISALPPRQDGVPHLMISYHDGVHFKCIEPDGKTRQTEDLAND